MRIPRASVVFKNNDVFIITNDYLDMGTGDKWGEYFSYDGSTRKFYFKALSWGKFSRAVHWLKSRGVDVIWDKEQAKRYYSNRQEQENLKSEELTNQDGG